MKSVLRGFLGTYTSRYSDYRGYWVHGQLPPDLLECTIDLLGSASLRDGPTEAAELCVTTSWTSLTSSRHRVRQPTSCTGSARVPG